MVRREGKRRVKSDMQFQDCETSHASVRVTRRIMKFSVETKVVK